MNPNLTEFQAKADKIRKLLEDDLMQIKTGRAKPSLVEHIKVKVYGESWMEVRELASISAPDAHSLVISPWDKSILKDMERGLAASEARLNPVVDGEILRIKIPSLTEESRHELVKLVKQKVESHKAMVRQERAHTKKLLEEEKNHSGVSEDDVKRNLDELQKITDSTIAALDKLSTDKEIEVMTV